MGKRILIVDDWTQISEVLLSVLTPMGHEVVCAGTLSGGKRAWTQMGPFDVVLCDWHIGDEDGLPWAEELHVSRQKTFLFSSAQPPKGTIVEWVDKNISLADLVKKLTQ